MKGLMFSTLEKFVIQKYGLDFWNGLLEKRGLDHELFIFNRNYQDKLFYQMLVDIEDEQNIDKNLLINNFGEFSFLLWKNRVPKIFDYISRPDELLFCFNQSLGAEIQKIYADIKIPVIDATIDDQGDVLVSYLSQKKLGQFLKGMILGMAKFYHYDVIFREEKNYSIRDQNKEKNVQMNLRMSFVKKDVANE